MKKLVVFAAPSGSGKSTIVKHLLSKIPALSFSVSATTRAPRNNEVNGRDYYFISLADFRSKIQQNEFVEWEEVYPEVYYGTLKEEIDKLWFENKTVIFDIDVYGALAIKKIYPEETLTIYVDVPKFEDIQKRLALRNTESPEQLQKRVHKAQHESSFKNKFDKILVNDVLEETFQQATELVLNFIKSQ
jgi:guanylate kinase